MARPGTDSCAGDGRSVDVGARFGGDGCLAADSDDEKTQMRFPALFLLGSLMALAFGVLELGLWWSPPADRSPLDEYFDAMSFDAKRAAVMKMTDEEDVLLVASSEDLIASPVGTYAALRLADLWAGDSRAIDRAMDRLLSETDPGMMLALLTALNSENTLRALAGEAAPLPRLDDLIFRLYEDSPELAFRYRVLAAAATFSVATTDALLEDGFAAPREGLPGHPELSNRVALSLALQQGLRLSEDPHGDVAISNRWQEERGRILNRVEALARMPDIDVVAFDNAVTCLRRFGSGGELEALVRDLPPSASAALHRILHDASQR